jgi:DNA-binding transcriptional regulator of glucitol operon
MDVMLKISIVLLTTTFFAGLLIVDPYGSSPVSFQTAAAKIQNQANVPTATVAAQPAPATVVAVATQPDVRVTDQETRLVAMADAAPDMLTPAQPASGVLHRPEKAQRERVVQVRLRRHA